MGEVRGRLRVADDDFPQAAMVQGERELEEARASQEFRTGKRGSNDNDDGLSFNRREGGLYISAVPRER